MKPMETLEKSMKSLRKSIKFLMQPETSNRILVGIHEILKKSTKSARKSMMDMTPQAQSLSPRPATEWLSSWLAGSRDSRLAASWIKS